MQPKKSKKRALLSKKVFLCVTIPYCLLLILPLSIWLMKSPDEEVDLGEGAVAVMPVSFDQVIVEPTMPEETKRDVSEMTATQETTINEIQPELQESAYTGEEEVVKKQVETPAQATDVADFSSDHDGKPLQIQRSTEDGPTEESVAKSEVVAGVNAPHYCLEDESSLHELLSSHGGRLLVTDGVLAYDVGNDINNQKALRLINNDTVFTARFSRRVAIVPESWSYGTKVAQKFPSHEITQQPFSVCVCLPKTSDSRILERQIEYFGEKPDIHATTVLRVRGSTINVLGLLPKDGLPSPK